MQVENYLLKPLLTKKETAEVLGVSIGTVSRLIFRGN
jgi:DNA-directed RNA polymerase specialized sigma24 family protein